MVKGSASTVALVFAGLHAVLAFPSTRDESSAGRLITFPPPLTDTGAKLIPDSAHPFQAPKAGDQRGPCPGLNTLANHGYLPRSGVMSAEELIDGVQEGFNLEYNFSVALAGFAVLTRGNAYLDLFSIGGESESVPPLPGNIDGTPGGLGKHGRFEGDVSMTRADAAIGDNVHFQPDMYANLLSYVDRFGDGEVVTTQVFQEYRFARFQDSLSRDPQLTFHVGREGFGYGEAGFILNLFPNSKQGNLTVPVMNSFFQNETFPGGWFRHATPFSFQDIGVAAGAVEEPHPVAPGAKNASGTYVPDTDPNLTGACGLYYNLIGQNIPGVLLNTTGILRKNVDTLLDGIFTIFSSSCTQIAPFGPAGV